MNRTIERFSNGYWLVNAETVAFSGDRVTIPYDLGDDLSEYVIKPLFKIGNRHVWPQEARDIPPNAVAIPQESDISAGDEVLLAKNRTAAHLIRTERVRPPHP